MNTKTNFTFLPNGKPVSSLKNEAKKLHKSGEVKGLSNAQNKISKALFNKSFNKLSKDVEELSPMLNTINDESILYIPIRITKEDVCNEVSEDFTYYFVMNNKMIAGSSEHNLDIEEYIPNDFLNNLKFKNFERLNFNCEKNSINNLRGWNIYIDENHFIQVNKSDECIFFEVFYQENDSLHSICSNYISYDEIIYVSSDYDHWKDQNISDYEMSCLLQHDSEMEKSHLYSIGGIDVILYGNGACIENDGSQYSLSDFKSKMEQEGKGDLFVSWLHGRYIEEFSHLEISASPYFGFESDNELDFSDAIFSTLPKSLSEKAFDIAEFFLYE